MKGQAKNGLNLESGCKCSEFWIRCKSSGFVAGCKGSGFETHCKSSGFVADCKGSGFETHCKCSVLYLWLVAKAADWSGLGLDTLQAGLKL